MDVACERSPSSSRLRRWVAWRIYLLPVMLVFAVTLPKINQGEFRTDTGWYTAIALQAWRTGSFWTLYGEPGQPYFNKPPLAFWIHGALLHMLGPELWIARVPTVVACVGCVVVTVGLSRLFAGRTMSLAIGCVLALSLDFVRRTHEVSLDMWQLLFMLLGMRAAVRGAIKGGVWRFAVGGAWIGLALMCKPLVALLVPLIVFAWLVVCEIRVGSTWVRTSIPRSREVIPRTKPDFGEDTNVGARGLGDIWLGPLVMVACAIAVAAPWHVSMMLLHGREFTAAYFGAEISARVAGDFADTTSTQSLPWFYLVRLARNHWPWLACIALAFVVLIRGRPLLRDGRGTWLAIMWSLAWFFAISVFADRRDRYALPLFPGLAMVAGAWCARWSGVWLRRVQRRFATWIPISAVVLCVGVSVIPFRMRAREDPSWTAMFEWLRDRGEPQVWQGAFMGDRGARLYLEFERWPITTRNRWGEFVVDRMHEPPAGALLMYHRRDGLAPGPNEDVVWTMRDLTVTRLISPPWSPIEVPDPGVWRGP